MSPEAPEPRSHRTRRIPSHSFFYERLVPIIFILLALVTVVLITFAAGVLFGVVHYR